MNVATQDVIDQRPGAPAAAGMTLRQYEIICREILDQPNWRAEADKCDDYVDNNQLDAETLDRLQQIDLDPMTRNKIKPAIDQVLGIEAQNKRDWRVNGETDDYQDVAEGLSARLHEIERETHADRAISGAFEAQIRAGIGWVEVARNSDPFRYPYRVATVHRREIWWDWLSQEDDLSDARYLIRRKWFPKDQVLQYFPQHRQAIESALSGWGQPWLRTDSGVVDLAQGNDGYQRTTYDQLEWLDTNRERVCLYELRHRAYVRGLILRLPGDRVVEFDTRNPAHQMAVAQMGIKPEEAIYARVRKSLWAGPVKLVESGEEPNRLGYIPFWCYREARTGIPYGLTRVMMSPQDLTNKLLQKFLWLLSAKRVEMDSDALDADSNDVTDVLAEVARADATIITNPNRINRNGNAVNVSTDLQVIHHVFSLLKDAELATHDAAGIYQAFLGNKQSGGDSGIAINSLVQQATTGLARVFDNYSHARRSVGQAILDLDRDTISGQQIDTVVESNPRNRKVITLNKPAVDEATGIPYLENDTDKCRVKVVLDDTPATPTYRQQLLLSMGEIVKSMPPEMQALMAPYYLELTDHPKRHEMSEVIRKATGLNDMEPQGEEPPEVAELKAQLEQAMATIQQLQQAPDTQLKQAQAAKTQAEATKVAQEMAANTAKALAETQLIRAQTRKTIEETVSIMHPEPDDGGADGRPNDAGVNS